MVTMLYRYAVYKNYYIGFDRTPEFTDIGAVSDYASDAVAFAVGSGIINGTGDGRILPGTTASRAQAASVLVRMAENNLPERKDDIT